MDISEEPKPKPKTVDVAADPNMQLVDWKALIERLIQEHGDHVWMYADGGYNNVDLRIEIEDTTS